MTEHPILFSAPMIKALLAGTKTQTRRVVKPMAGKQREWLTSEWLNQSPRLTFGLTSSRNGPRDPGVAFEHPRGGPGGWIRSPFGGPGDLLWCRETWAPRGVSKIGGGPLETLIAYRADGAMHTFPHHEVARVVGEWKPSIFMPRWASRITLEITDVRVERLNDISEADAIAEGVEKGTNPKYPDDYKYYGELEKLGQITPNPVWSYQSLWESINGVGSWALNPWVWVLEFKRITP